MLFLTGSIYGQQVGKITPKGTKYLLYTPPGYTDANEYPLLVVLHGQGTIGDDLNLLLSHRDEIPSKLIAQNKWPSRYPFIVVTPQLKRDESVEDPRDQLWPPDLVEEVVEQVVSSYAVNRNKIYVTGLSLGGHGSYSYAAAYPSRIAAFVMISGVPDSTIACQVKDIPLWAFHGSDDRLVRPVFPQGMIRSINACSPPGKFRPQLTLLYGRKHEGWNDIYNNTSGYNIYDWFLKFTKNDPSNTPPYVNAGKDLTLAAREGSIHVYGAFFDSDGTIAQVTWSKTRGPEVALADTHSKLLKLSSAPAGIYEFELTVTDDDGAQARDRVEITIVPEGDSSPAVTSLTLMDGSTQQDIEKLYDGYFLNPETTPEINLRAGITGNAGSVRFKVSSDDNARTIDAPPYLLANPRWTVAEGEYLVCATPFSGAQGTGTSGISQCFKIIVSTQAPPPPPPPPPPKEDKHFYAKAGADISMLAAWSSNAEGTGAAPTSFSASGQTFDVGVAAALNNALAIDGTGSVFRIIDGGELTLNQQLNAPVNMEAGAVLHVNTGHALTPGSLDPSSVIHFNANAHTIPGAYYGQVNLNGSGSIKTLSPGTTSIEGALTISDGVILEGAADLQSVLNLSGDVTIHATDDFSPDNSFTLTFDTGRSQLFNLRSSRFALHKVVISPNTTVQVNTPDKCAFELGSPTGGGLVIHSGAALLTGKNDLVITEMGTINPANETGKIGFGKSELKIISSAATSSNLYTVTGADSLSMMSVDLSGAGTVILHGPVHIVDRISVANGTVNSNGHLSLVSTRDQTARVTAGAGKISGDVVFQRYLPKGKQTRYLSFPVKGVTVRALQETIPVTGNFSGASTGEDLPDSASLHRFHEPSGGWIAFPETNNTETFQPGHGYSVLIPDDTRDTKVMVSGPLHAGPFSYSLTPNAGNDPAKGWNLIGNPYASPLRWDPQAWTLAGTATAAYLLDDRYPGGRFLVWDGTVGDPEFGGIVAQGQGLFIRTTDDSPLLTISEQAKADTSVSITRVTRTESETSHLVVTLKQDDLIDRAYLKFSEQAGDHFEEADAVKRKNGYFSVSSLSSDSVSLAINHLSETFCDRSIALSLDTPTPGNYALAFDGTRFKDSPDIRLTDQVTNTTVNLQQGTEYSFQVNADDSYGENRFVIEMPSGGMEDPVITVGETLLTSNMVSGNQWMLNGEDIEGATETTYVPLVSGEYSLRVTIDGCSRVAEAVSVTVTVTGIHEYNGSDLTFYPNPASHFIRIQLKVATPGLVHYSITNALGMEMSTGAIASSTLLVGSDINITGFPSGSYFLTLRTSAGWKFQRKFVVDP